MSAQESAGAVPAADRRSVGAAAGAFAYDEPIVTRPKWPAWARLVAMPVILLLYTFAPILPQLPLRGLSIRELNDWLQLLIGMGFMLLGALTAVLLIWLMARKVDGMSLRDCGLKFDRSLPTGLLVGYAAVMAVMVPAGLLIDNLGFSRAPEEVGTDFWLGLVHYGLILGIIAQGFPEELVYRGYGIATLRDRPVRAVWIMAAWFGIIHLFSIGGQENVVERVLYLAGPFGFAVLAGALALVTRSVWAAVGVHGGSHLATYLLSFVGFGSGPVLWVVEGTLLTVFGALIMYRWQRNRAVATA